MKNSKVYINDLATRSFRDVADKDYIAARLCYRNDLMLQFLWMSQQAIEKYLKAILLYNHQSTKKLGHKLEKAIERINKIENFRFNIDERAIKFIKYLDQQGVNRYLELAHYTIGRELLDLDHAVWQIRRYCKVMNYSVALPDGTNKNMYEAELNNADRWLV